MTTPNGKPLTEKLGLRDEPVQTSVNVDSNGTSSGEKDYLKLLELALLMPVLSLVKMYMAQTNGTKKTTENCMLEFRNKHGRAFFVVFCLDFLFRLGYLAVVIIVAIRGLGIDQYLVSFCSK